MPQKIILHKILALTTYVVAATYPFITLVHHFTKAPKKIG